MPLNYSILIVEQDAMLRDQFCKHFVQIGMDVTAVTHPRQALCAVNNRPYQVAIVGESLQETDGVSLMLRLRKMVRGLKVILIAEKKSLASTTDVLAAGAFDCLLKPCRMSELQRVVEEAVEAEETSGDPEASLESQSELETV